jgi:putative transposase
MVQPDTLVRWHRHIFRLFWRFKSRPRGRPRIPQDLQQLIAEMARVNRTWGEERIAAELLLKLGISISPRTVRRYMRRPPSSSPGSETQTWSIFVRNHARDILACDFFVTVADWTVQQFRACLTGESTHRFLIHDRDCIYSSAVDGSLRAMGLRVLKTPAATPQANACCERVMGTA